MYRRAIQVLFKDLHLESIPLTMTISHTQSASMTSLENSSVDHDALQRCSEMITHHSKSFSFASHLFPPSLKDDVAILYAWCRRVDDSVDEVPHHQAGHALKILQEELDELYAPQLSIRVQNDDVLRAFRTLIFRKNIPKHYPQELLEGMKMDLMGIHYQSLNDLYLYCYRVAGVVGLMMCHLMGVRKQEALYHAIHLGIGMQLTNICRDVSEDWGRGRLYLPFTFIQETCQSAPLQEHPLLKEELFQALEHNLNQSTSGRFHQSLIPNRFQRAVSESTLTLLTHASQHYQIGYQGLGDLPWRMGMTIQTAGWIYHDIGRIIENRQGDPNQPRATTSTLRKGSLLLCSMGSFIYTSLLNKIKNPSLNSPSFQIPTTPLTFKQFFEHFLKSAPFV